MSIVQSIYGCSLYEVLMDIQMTLMASKIRAFVSCKLIHKSNQRHKR